MRLAAIAWLAFGALHLAACSSSEPTGSGPDGGCAVVDFPDRIADTCASFAVQVSGTPAQCGFDGTFEGSRAQCASLCAPGRSFRCFVVGGEAGTTMVHCTEDCDGR